MQVLQIFHCVERHDHKFHFFSCCHLKGGSGRAGRAIRWETTGRFPSSKNVSRGFLLPSTGLSSGFVFHLCLPHVSTVFVFRIRLPYTSSVYVFCIHLSYMSSGFVFWLCLLCMSSGFVFCVCLLGLSFQRDFLHL